MKSSKWISDLSAKTPLEDAAKRVLGARLQVIGPCLAPAIQKPEKDAEFVHQLRVGARRARSALDVFAECLPSKVYKSAKKNLRHLRAAAGDARDWDIFLESLRSEIQNRDGSRVNNPGLDCLIGYALSQRLNAQVTLRQMSPKVTAFERLESKLMRAVRQPTEKKSVLIDLACPKLLELVQKLDAAAVKDLDNYEHLHEVRLVGKKLRYAMEIFVSCFPGEFRKVYYAAIEQMQDILGRANDSFVANQRLSGLALSMQAMIPREWSSFEADVQSLIEFHKTRLPKEHAMFKEWWNNWQNGPDGKNGLIELLKNSS